MSLDTLDKNNHLGVGGFFFLTSLATWFGFREQRLWSQKGLGETAACMACAPQVQGSCSAPVHISQMCALCIEQLKPMK